jgi:hemerythrin
MNHEITETQAYARHLLREHRRLHQMLRRVEESWPAAESARQDAVLIGRLLTAVEELRGELAKHFAEEESGGVLEEAVAREPGLGPEESRLIQEHASLLSDLDEVIAGLRSAQSAGQLTGELEQQFQSFTKRLNGHEAAENRVLAEGFRIEVN